MAVATPPAGASNGAIVRWAFEMINAHDVPAMRQLWTDATAAPFEGIEPTDRAVAIDGMDHFVIRDGTVATSFVVFEQMQFVRQIGMLPADGSPGDRATKAAFNAKTRLRSRSGRS